MAFPFWLRDVGDVSWCPCIVYAVPPIRFGFCVSYCWLSQHLNCMILIRWLAISLNSGCGRVVFCYAHVLFSIQDDDYCLSGWFRAVLVHVYTSMDKNVLPFNEHWSGPIPHRVWPECGYKIMPKQFTAQFGTMVRGEDTLRV